MSVVLCGISMSISTYCRASLADNATNGFVKGWFSESGVTKLRQVAWRVRRLFWSSGS